MVVYIHTMVTAIYDRTMEYRLKDVPGDIWKALKHICVDEEKSLNNKIIELIKEEIAKKGKP